MADKYAPKELSREERAANVMHARLSWRDAERYAAMLAGAGVLDSGDTVLAVALLSKSLGQSRAEQLGLGRPRAVSIVADLQMYRAMATPGDDRG